MTSSRYLNLKDPRMLTGILVTFKLLIHLATNSIYGFHRDELLYMALGDHLMWGFQEVPPSIAVLAKLAGTVLGDSVSAYRLFPAMAGMATLLLACLAVIRFGGGYRAVLFTGIALLISPAFLRMNTLFQPVAFDVLYWTVLFYLAPAVAKKTPVPSDWLLLGLALGLGMLNKYAIVFAGIPLAAALLILPSRTVFLTRWPWISAGLALLIWAPNLIWQIRNQFPVVDHMAELRDSQLVHVSAADFILGQFELNLVAGLLFIPGIWFLVRNPETRIVVWMYGLSFLLFLLFSGKSYYLAGAYPVLFAAGGVWLEAKMAGRFGKWIPGAFALMVLLTLPLIPYGAPVLPVQTMKNYAGWMADHVNLTPPLVWEDDSIHDLPQDFADMFGWEEQVQSVASVWYSLPDSVREKTVIFAENYGQAGALAHFGKAYQLPYPVSLSSSFYFFGPGEKPGTYLLSVGLSREDLAGFFSSVSLKRIHTSDVAREKRVEIFFSEGIKASLQKAWPGFRNNR